MVKKKGYWASEMQNWDIEKMRSVLEQFGKEGLTENTYNYLKRRVPERETTQSRVIEPVERIQPVVSGLNVAAAPVATIQVSDKDADEYLKIDNDTYYGGTAAKVDVGGKKKKATRQSAREFVQENINDPETLFNPNYANTRKQLTKSDWYSIFKAHPEYYNEKYARYIPDDVQSMLYRNGIRKEMDKAGTAIAPYLIGAGMAPLGAAFAAAGNPLVTFGSQAGSVATDMVVEGASNGKYSNWVDYAADKFNVDTNTEYGNFKKVALGAVNPGALFMGTMGTGAFGNPVNLNGELVLSDNILPSGYSTIERTIHNVPGQTIKGFKIPKRASTIKGNTLGRKTGNSVGQALYQTVTKPVQINGGTTTIPYNLSFPLPYTTVMLPDDPTVSSPPISTIPPYTTTSPSKINFYSTAYDWGDAAFQKWWRENAPGNEGKVLDYNGRKIKIEYSPTGYRRTNLRTITPGGVYPQGTVSGRRVLNVEPITYTGAPIGYQQVGVTDLRFTRDPLLYGETVTRKQGGKVDYYKFFINK